MHRAEKSSQTSCNQQISGIGAAIAPTSSESPIEHAWRKTPRETYRYIQEKVKVNIYKPNLSSYFPKSVHQAGYALFDPQDRSYA